MALAGRKVLIFDVRQLSMPEQVRESPLKYQTRKVACSPDGRGFSISSVEGKIGIEYFNQDAQEQALKYQFKCHRVGDVAYPVNAIVYHPKYGNI